VALVVTFETLEDADIDELLADQKAREDQGKGIRCSACGQRVTSADQRMAQGGSHEHRFSNPAGFEFHIGCFRTAPGCSPAGAPTEAWTWFRGYAWSVALCTRCGAHLGWAYGPGGAGEGFYGLILDRLQQEQ
jgi:hypothetical protein